MVSETPARLHVRISPGLGVCRLDFSSGPIIPCRWLRKRSFRSPGFAPTHFGSPGKAPTHTFASNFPPSQAAGGKAEAFAVLQSAKHPVIRQVHTVLFRPPPESLDFIFFLHAKPQEGGPPSSGNLRGRLMLLESGPEDGAGLPGRSRRDDADQS